MGEVKGAKSLVEIIFFLVLHGNKNVPLTLRTLDASYNKRTELVKGRNQMVLRRRGTLGSHSTLFIRLSLGKNLSNFWGKRVGWPVGLSRLRPCWVKSGASRNNEQLTREHPAHPAEPGPKLLLPEGPVCPVGPTR